MRMLCGIHYLLAHADADALRMRMLCGIHYLLQQRIAPVLACAYDTHTIEEHTQTYACAYACGRCLSSARTASR